MEVYSEVAAPSSTNPSRACPTRGFDVTLEGDMVVESRIPLWMDIKAVEDVVVQEGLLWRKSVTFALTEAITNHPGGLFQADWSTDGGRRVLQGNNQEQDEAARQLKEKEDKGNGNNKDEGQDEGQDENGLTAAQICENNGQIPWCHGNAGQGPQPYVFQCHENDNFKKGHDENDQHNDDDKPKRSDEDPLNSDVVDGNCKLKDGNTDPTISCGEGEPASFASFCIKYGLVHTAYNGNGDGDTTEMLINFREFGLDVIMCMIAGIDVIDFKTQAYVPSMEEKTIDYSSSVEAYLCTRDGAVEAKEPGQEDHEPFHQGDEIWICICTNMYDIVRIHRIDTLYFSAPGGKSQTSLINGVPVDTSIVDVPGYPTPEANCDATTPPASAADGRHCCRAGTMLFADFYPSSINSIVVTVSGATTMRYGAQETRRLRERMLLRRDLAGSHDNHSPKDGPVAGHDDDDAEEEIANFATTFTLTRPEDSGAAASPVVSVSTSAMIHVLTSWAILRAAGITVFPALDNLF
jgi:hypothetical protein